MKLLISIEVQDDDRSECGRNCLFNNGDNFCLLFAEPIKETELPEHHVWQDGVTPTNQRCYKCLAMEEE